MTRQRSGDRPDLGNTDTLSAGWRANFVTHMKSADQSSTGIAWHSAQREHQRRHTARRERAKARYGPVGTLLASVTADPATIQAWQQGAAGEIATAHELARRLRRSDVIVIHDRRIPGRGRANIDHVAIGPGGVTVIDTKSSRGEVHITTAGVLHRREQLLVNGHDRTRELDTLQRQIAAVTRVLDRQGLAGVSVLGALCYPYMRRRLLHYSRARDGLITVDDRRHIAKVANRPGPISPSEIEQLAGALIRSFPAA
jgi:Nuclease-related domain